MIRVRVAALAFLAWAGTWVPAHGQSVDEYEVKAVFLLNFARYVEWPDSTFDSPDAPLTICVVGTDPFGAQLETTIGGRSANGRPLALRRVGPGEPVGVCHIAFLASHGRQEIRVPRELAAGPTLLVSDDPDFLAQGGAIALTMERQRVRFNVNLGAAEQRRLRVSAKLLQAAQRVTGSPGQRLKP